MNVVFAGPSIWGVPADSYASFDVRPPARAGDILRAVADGASTIGLIDGVFRNARSVQHKEILFALHRGVTVLGASSIGALRAAECARFGMLGIGEIYQQYASGARCADADVCLVHAPAELDHQPLTLPLVDVEATLQSRTTSDVWDPTNRTLLLEAARTLHFSDRTLDRMLETAVPGHDAHTSIRRQWEQNFVSQKRLDAIALLTEMRNGNPRHARGAPPFTRTLFFDAFEESTMQGQR